MGGQTLRQAPAMQPSSVWISAEGPKLGFDSAKVGVRPALLEMVKSGISKLCSLACTGLGISAGPSRSVGDPVVQGTKPISTARVTARPPQSPRSRRQQTRSSRRSPSPGPSRFAAPFPAVAHGLPRLFLIFLLSSLFIVVYISILAASFVSSISCILGHFALADLLLPHLFDHACGSYMLDFLVDLKVSCYYFFILYLRLCKWSMM